MVFKYNFLSAVYLISLGVFINVAGGVFTTISKSFLFLDMIGTALCAFVIGPTAAIVTAFSSQFLMTLFYARYGGDLGVPITGHMDFVIVNICGAVAWAYFVRKEQSNPFCSRLDSYTSCFFRVLRVGIYTGVACSIYAAAVVWGYQFDGALESCFRIEGGSHPAGFAAYDLGLALKRIFVEGGADCISRLGFLVSYLCVSIPDKIVVTALAFLAVSYIFPLGRKGDFPYPKTKVSTRRKSAFFVWYVAFGYIFTTEFSSYASLDWSDRLDSGVIKVFIVSSILWLSILFPALINQGQMWVRIKCGNKVKVNGEYAQLCTPQPHPSSRDVYEDLLKLIISYFGVVYFIISFSPRIQMRYVENINDFVDGGVSTVSILLILRYVPTIVSKFFSGEVREAS